MHRLALFTFFNLLLLIFSSALVAQDERNFREIFSDKYANKVGKFKYPTHYFYKANTPLYKIDLTRDGYREGLVYERVDGESWFYVYNNFNKLVKRFYLPNKGLKAHVYKVQLKSVSSRVNVLIIYLYEGYQKWLGFHGTTKLYFLTIIDGDINGLHLSEGPVVYEEARERDWYSRRKFLINAKDYDEDGLKEIIIEKGLTKLIYYYKEDINQWKRI